MRKTLLMTAAALAAGIISTQAQVYSQNIVGYVNLTVPTNGFNVLANQLDIGDGTNGFSQVLANGNFVSDPAAENNTVLYIWNQSSQGYANYYYFSAADASANSIGTQAGWYDGSYNYQSYPLPPGAPFILDNINNTHSNITFTLTGSIPVTSTNIVTIVSGFSQFAYTAPVATDLILSNNFVGTSDPAALTNDTLYVWNPASQGYANYYYFSAADANANSIGTQAGFYNGSYVYTPIVPQVGQGLLYFHYGGVGSAYNEYWTNSFNF